MNTTRSTLAAVPLIVLFAACRSEADPMGFALRGRSLCGLRVVRAGESRSTWSNSGFCRRERLVVPQRARTLLHFDAAGGFGNNDIWMSERQCLACPWEAPVNLGAVINTDAIEASPSVSEDGSCCFFLQYQSRRFR